MKIEIRRRSSLAMSAMAMGLLFNRPPAYARDDFGSWHVRSVKFLNNERWTLSLFTQLRFRDDSSEPARRGWLDTRALI